jgi:hypothetical protein
MWSALSPSSSSSLSVASLERGIAGGEGKGLRGGRRCWKARTDSGNSSWQLSGVVAADQHLPVGILCLFVVDKIVAIVVSPSRSVTVFFLSHPSPFSLIPPSHHPHRRISPTRRLAAGLSILDRDILDLVLSVKTLVIPRTFPPTLTPQSATTVTKLIPTRTRDMQTPLILLYHYIATLALALVHNCSLHLVASCYSCLADIGLCVPGSCTICMSRMNTLGRSTYYP